jgi:hypothetical protein
MADGDRTTPVNAGGSDSETGRSRDPNDPTTIRSLAVTTDDVLTALEANERRDRGAVLRVTPPFAGRMRARLHVVGGEGAYDGDVRPLHLSPATFLDGGPSYPSVDETEDELRASEREYTADRHERWHTDAVETWRERVRDSLRDRITVETTAGPHDVVVKYLG